MNDPHVVPPDMYERAYWQVQKILDTALGKGADAGTGEGIVADVALLVQRYEEAEGIIVAHLGAKGIRLLRESDARPLREVPRESDGTVSIYSPLPRPQTHGRSEEVGDGEAE